MPYANNLFNQLKKRNYHRTRRHGNWRQTWIDCGGMCVWKECSGEVCGEVMGLEFHEAFGEDHKGDGRMQQRILLCRRHHDMAHPQLSVNTTRPYSRLNEDVQAEILLCGSYERWLVINSLDEKRWMVNAGTVGMIHLLSDECSAWTTSSSAINAEQQQYQKEKGKESDGEMLDWAGGLAIV